jgi:hypothetical protein
LTWTSYSTRVRDSDSVWLTSTVSTKLCSRSRKSHRSKSTKRDQNKSTTPRSCNTLKRKISTWLRGRKAKFIKCRMITCISFLQPSLRRPRYPKKKSWMIPNGFRLSTLWERIPSWCSRCFLGIGKKKSLFSMVTRPKPLEHQPEWLTSLSCKQQRHKRNRKGFKSWKI